MLKFQKMITIYFQFYVFVIEKLIQYSVSDFKAKQLQQSNRISLKLQLSVFYLGNLESGRFDLSTTNRISIMKNGYHLLKTVKIKRLKGC